MSGFLILALITCTRRGFRYVPDAEGGTNNIKFKKFKTSGVQWAEVNYFIVFESCAFEAHEN